MASALLGALAPAAISALTSGGGSSSGGGGSNVLGGLIQEGVKKSGGIMSGIGGFVSDLLHGKGFKESLAGGIDTMIGRTPSSASPGTTTTGTGQVPVTQGGKSIWTGSDEQARNYKLSMMGMKIERTGTDDGGRYVVAVIPLSSFKNMVMLYMSQKGFPQVAIDAVAAEIDAGGKESASARPDPLGPMTADQNRAIGQANASQYGFPILAPASVTSRSADYMFPKYDARPKPSPTAALQQSPPIPQGMPAGGISTSGGSVAGLQSK